MQVCFALLFHFSLGFFLQVSTEKGLHWLQTENHFQGPVGGVGRGIEIGGLQPLKQTSAREEIMRTWKEEWDFCQICVSSVWCGLSKRASGTQLRCPLGWSYTSACWLPLWVKVVWGTTGTASWSSISVLSSREGE